MTIPAPVLDALRASRGRKALATALDTTGIRALDAGLRARSVFTARGVNVLFADSLKTIIDSLASGAISESGARLAIIETLRRLGYTPEGGFPDTPAGEIPPAVAGSLRDLSSAQRVDLIVRTQIDLMAGAGQQWRGHQPDDLALYPAWELVRIEPRRTPRNWGGKNPNRKDPRSRWLVAGGRFYQAMPGMDAGADAEFQMPSRMIALKGDPVWGELGGSGNFPDALDVDYPPFAFRSGMGWKEISREECDALGVVGPNGETIDDFHQGMERPRVILGELPLPSPKLSLRDVDPKLVKDFVQETKATPDAAKPDVFDFSDLLEKEIAAHDAAYEKGGGK